MLIAQQGHPTRSLESQQHRILHRHTLNEADASVLTTSCVKNRATSDARCVEFIAREFVPIGELPEFRPGNLGKLLFPKVNADQ